MKCKGNFKFKGLQKKDGGEFTNSNGQVVKYSESYVLKVDEIGENGVDERLFKINVDSELINALKDLKIYADISIEFDIKFSGNNIRVIPIAIYK